MESKPVELVCREVVELVTEYLSGTLSAADRVRFDEHLATCPPCTAYLAQVRTTIELAAEVGATRGPDDGEVAKRLGDLFRRWHDKRDT